MACVLPYGVSVLNPSEFCDPILNSREIQNGPSGPVGGSFPWGLGCWSQSKVQTSPSTSGLLFHPANPKLRR